MTRHRFGRVAGIALAATIAATLTSGMSTIAAAAADGPSVPLPATPSVAVNEQKMASRGADQATIAALTGDQPAGSTKDGSGNNRATPLSQSASWDVSAQTGDFTWSYPLRVPPSPGGFQPDLALGYASSDVDGRTSATNNQASWAGDGWNLGVGFVERTYLPCADDEAGGTIPPKEVGDLCWRSDNASASYSGGGGQLILDADNGWRSRNDDGSRIERLTSGDNGDDNGEYWRITTVDGTQYLFGSRKNARSTWTVPVFGDDAHEPCNDPGNFAGSDCVQAWRWNLDKVIDRNGNVIVYNYLPETNSYGFNNKDAAVSYVRGGTLHSAEYGLREGSTEPATGRVDFVLADRCVPGSDCVAAKKDNWPDVPWDDRCDTATCKDKSSPTFWSTKRLAKVVTKVRDGDGFAEVDSWTLEHQFPDPGDGEKAALWLRSIVHTGHVGTAVSLPPVTFEGQKLSNRVNKVDGLGPLNRYRVNAVVSEAGGVISVKYAAPDCADGALPANPESNTKRCYPARWAKRNFEERTDYFHKYVVELITEHDRLATNSMQETRYEYLDGAAWAYDLSEFTKDEHRTWNDFRGFGKVRIRKGVPGDPSGPVTMTEQRFHRGMDGDRQPNNGKRSVSVEDSEDGRRTDHEWLRGQRFETLTYDGVPDRVVTKSITTPVWQGPTATRGDYKAYIIGAGKEVSYTALAAGGWRTTKTETTYDDRGLPVTVHDHGDTATDTDDQCTTTTYVRNVDRWLLNYPSRVETVAAKCADTPVFPADAISDSRTAYDGKPFGQAPDKGNATRVEIAKERPAAGPQYTLSSTTAYDGYGRSTSTTDALDRTTTTEYVPASGGPVTGLVAKNALGHETRTTLNTSFGLPVKVVDPNGRLTETTYDGLGRKTEVWLPNRTRGPNVGGNHKYTYLYRNDAPTVVTTSSVNPKGNYVTKNELYDGLLRLRQVQTPAVGGGRLIADTRYDSQGRKYKTTAPFFSDTPVDDKLWIADDLAVPFRIISEYDGAGRQIAEAGFTGVTEKLRITKAYGGDRVHVTPPAGTTPTTTITDAKGQTTELRQYHGAKPEGSYDSTKYEYTITGQPATVVDPAGNTWRHHYDFRQREVRTEDPDKGVSTKTYDDAGQVTSTTDARDVTLTYAYDKLGRKTHLKRGDTVLGEWTFDKALFGKGLPTTSTRYVAGNAYSSTVVGYGTLNTPTQTQVAVPQNEGKLSGTYTSYATYNVDGSVKGTTYPKIGDLPVEQMTYEYNDHGLPHTTAGSATYVSDTNYTRYGEAQRVQLGAGTTRMWLSQYYETGTRRVERAIVDAEVPAPMQSDVHYTYDPSGNITSISDAVPGDVQCFRMDHLQRLTEAWTPGDGCAADPSEAALAGPAPYWQSFTYDKVGNRLTEELREGSSRTARTSTYTGHKIDSVVTSGGVTATEEFTYDAIGNTVKRGGQTLEWDAEGRLTTVTTGGKDTSFLYDADGNRLIRRDAAGTTLYLDGQELRLTPAGALQPTRYYQHGGTVVAVRDLTSLTWLASDHQGTSSMAVNSGTLEVKSRRQLPFGAPRGEAVDLPGEKGFVGGTEDASARLTTLGARQYDPLLGRFISVDPVIDTNDSQQMHGYTYANNSPLTKSDPTGLLWGWLQNTVDFIDKHKNSIAVGLTVVALIPGIGTGAVAALTAANVLISVWDTKQSLADDPTPKNVVNVGLNVVGGILGVAGAGLRAGAKLAQADDLLDVGRTAKWPPKSPKPDEYLNPTPTGSGYDDLLAAGKMDVLAAGPQMGGAVLTYQPDDWMMEGDSGAPSAYRVTNFNCHDPEGSLGPHGCTPGMIYDTEEYQFCKTNPGQCIQFGVTTRGMLPGMKKRPAPNLGYGRPSKSEVGYHPPRVSGGSGIWVSNDGLHHRADGKGLAWF